MEWKSWFRSSLILLVLMIGLFMLLATFGANIGPVELLIWLAILVVGLVLVGLGSRRSANRKSTT